MHVRKVYSTNTPYKLKTIQFHPDFVFEKLRNGVTFWEFIDGGFSSMKNYHNN